MQRSTFLKILRAQGFKKSRARVDSTGHKVVIYTPTAKHSFALITRRGNGKFNGGVKIVSISIHHDSKIDFHYKIINRLKSQPEGVQIYKMFYDDMKEPENHGSAYAVELEDKHGAIEFY